MSLDYAKQIDAAAFALASAKITEAVAKDARLQAENVVIALLPSKEKGSVSRKGTDYKAAVTYDQTITVDPEALAAIKSEIDPELFAAAIKYKPEVRAAGLKDMKENHPDAYAVLAQALTIKPAKPKVAVEAVRKAVADNTDNYELAA